VIVPAQPYGWAGAFRSSVSASSCSARLGTFSYEVLCGIGPRVPRRNVASPVAGNGQALSAVPAGGASD
jgi:hypothetical protein